MVIWLQRMFHRVVCDRESESCDSTLTVVGDSVVHFGTSCVNFISDAAKRNFPVLM